jgi:putative tricarboxylic transport membrane protein
LLGNPIMLIQGKLLTPLFARLVTIRSSILLPLIMLFCFVGAYIFRNNMGDVGMALVFGVFGYFLRKIEIPMAPLVIAFILTPMAEEAMKQSLLLSDGDFSIFITRPISALFIGISVLLLGASIFKRPAKLN